MKVAIIRFPGSNCDDDARYVIEDILGKNTVMLWHRETDLQGADAVLLPGGFSYGDYLRTGALAAQSPIMDTVKTFANKGGLVIGICNGFQILTESGLLPGQLARNPRLHYLCQDVHLSVEHNSTSFSSDYQPKQILTMPIAHNEGGYYADVVTLTDLEENNQVVLRYCTKDGNVNDTANPNGSLNNIAGIINKQGNVLGMMPHPERASEVLLGSDDGLGIFRSLLETIESRLVT